MALGQKTGGRRRGTPNRRTGEVAERLAALGCDPIEGMAAIAMGDVPCPACDGSGEVAGSRGGPGETCEACHGRGREPIRAELRAKMLAELAGYVYPKRKAVELDAPTGNPIQLALLPGSETL